jgi:hypothetical protein
MTPRMISPTTSSIIAALESTTPKRVSVSPLVARTVKVVPSEVEHSAAPAAKACTGVIGNRPRRAKERPMGAAIPVRATAEDRKRFARRDFRLLEIPPIGTLAGSHWNYINVHFSPSYTIRMSPM